MTTRLLLVRHGLSKDNQTGLHSGELTCAGLSDLGFDQARALANRLSRNEISYVLISSPVRRAKETAEVIAKELRVSVQYMASLRELDAGDLEGISYEQHHDHVTRMWTSDRDLAFADGGESVNQAYDRMAAALREIVDVHPDQVCVVVTHGFAMLAAAERLVNHQGDPMPANASITEFVFTNDKWQLVSYNDHDHLA